MFFNFPSRHRSGVPALLVALALTTPAASAQPTAPLPEGVTGLAEPIDFAGSRHAVLQMEDDEVTLADAVTRAVERDPRIALFDARREEVAFLNREGKRWLADSPSLALVHTSDAAWSDEGYRQWDTLLQLPLWWPGQRGARGDVAKLSGEALFAAEAALKLTVAGKVRDGITQLALARTRLELARHELEVADALAQDVERAVALGERARLDWLAAREVALDRRDALVAAEAELVDASHLWRSVTGLDRVPARWHETAASGQSLDPEHPLLVAVRERVRRSEAELALARRDRWSGPEIAVGTQHERAFSRTSYNNRLIAGLRVPLGRAGGADARIARAQIVVGEARSAAAAQRRTLELALHEALHERESARRSFEVNVERNQVAEESQHLARRAFDLGEIGMAELLRAQARAFAAERQREEAELRREYAIAQLNQALGVVP